jgi:hypothetical protein
VGTSGASVTSSGTVFTVAVTGSFGLTTSQIQSLLNSGVSISVTGGTGNFNSLSVNSIPVSTSGHTHLSSSIIDFNSSVSGLLPVKNIVNSGYVSISSSSGIFTIGVTGLQPSGNYSSSGHQHLVADITNFNSGVSGLLTPYALLNSGNFTTLYVTGVPVSLSGHLHTSSQITDFNSSVSSLIPVKNVIGSGYINVSATTGNYIVSVSGLQPTGNYSLVGHSHLASDITNFNSSVSGLLPNVSGSGYIQSIFSNNSYLISVSGLQPSGNYSISGHTHTTNNITDFNSATSGLLTPYALLSSGNFTNLYVTGIPVSLSGHKHISADISDFSSSVSDLLLITNLTGNSGISITKSGTVFNVAYTGTPVSIVNTGLGRVLLSDGTSAGISGSLQLSYNNNMFSVSGAMSGVGALTPTYNFIISGGTP